MSLSDSLNWNLGIRMSARGRKLPDGKFLFSRIRFSVPPTDNIIVAVGSRDAKQTWKYGGICNIILPSSPSSTSQFAGGIILKDGSLPLGRLKFFSLSEYPKTQYSIELVPPNWFPSYTYECWWYDGANPTEAMRALAEIQAKINNIDSRI
ncbi:hypothetical protein [Nodularia sp. UHCC 0506]|uniref:hypothetical protein n=1 Tax=Nodularia sp. UHCC 0506 TaxID=3110243 RepID=UPI002B217A13|nr:hypothetical protein [Nodularia sp. UHCC 0506]MEA5516203.1 hypothetical protein [Nodularia sp. UHCC 0506]